MTPNTLTYRLGVLTDVTLNSPFRRFHSPSGGSLVNKGSRPISERHVLFLEQRLGVCYPSIPSRACGPLVPTTKNRNQLERRDTHWAIVRSVWPYAMYPLYTARAPSSSTSLLPHHPGGPLYHSFSTSLQHVYPRRRSLPMQYSTYMSIDSVLELLTVQLYSTVQ